MSKKKSRFAEKYWFARGYHHGLLGKKESPTVVTVDFLLSTLDIQVDLLYEEGWDRGVKDKEEGID